MWFIIAIQVIALAIYFYLIKPLKYWAEKGIPYVKGLPLFGNQWALISKQASVAEVFDTVYKTYPDRRYVGMFNFASPTLMVRDPDLIKLIMVKEFETFPDHRSFIDSKVDPIWNKNLFAMPGDERWHEMRTTLSPSFTPSKMRLMFGLMKECAQDFTEYFLKEDGTKTVEFRDAFARFSNDVIATTAFGVKCNSLVDRDNEFYRMGSEITNFRGLRGLVMMFTVFMPTISKILRIPLIQTKTVNFFNTIISETIKVRQEKNVIRPDMIHMLMEARKGRLNHDKESPITDAGFAVVEESDRLKHSKKRMVEVTDEDFAAHGFLFFFGGFETMSTMFTYVAYELALNPEVQKKLQEEVDQVYNELNGEMTYEALINMKYLDCVVSETLRKWPPFVGTTRKCVRDFKIEPETPDEVPLLLKKQTSCFIPFYSIQRDPKYFPNPEKFDPERFNDVNRKNIVPFTYLPFGAGPRTCIANRFSLIEGKILVAELVHKLEFVPVEQTKVTLKLSASSIVPMPDEGITLGIRKREK